MNTNTTNTNTNTNTTNMKERIMNKIHSIKNYIIKTMMDEKKFDVFATLHICIFVAFLLFLAIGGRSGIIDGLLVCVALWRIIYYFIYTKKSGKKRSVKDFMKAIYTQDDFEELRQDISKEMRIHYSTKETEEDLARKDFEKMRAFLNKHYRNTSSVYELEKDILSEAARFLVFQEQNGVGEECTLKDIEKFFNRNKEELLIEIMNIDTCKNGGYRDLCLAPGIAYFCTDKKALKSLRAKLRTAFTDSEIKLHDFSQQELAGENEATFRC